MQQVRSLSGHHMVRVTTEGVPLESTRLRVAIALGSAAAILTLVLTVFAVAYMP
ncbi:MAG: hypothetical protein ACXWUG_08515 [Polyangiales bacterium]